MEDKMFLIWIHERLRLVHKESPNIDYMHKLREVIGIIPDKLITSNKGSVSLDNILTMWDDYNYRGM